MQVKHVGQCFTIHIYIYVCLNIHVTSLIIIYKLERCYFLVVNVLLGMRFFNGFIDLSESEQDNDVILAITYECSMAH